MIYLYHDIYHASPEKYQKYKKYHDICQPRPPVCTYMYGGEAGRPGYVAISNYYERFITDVVVGPGML
jgi:hypothetical protein